MECGVIFVGAEHHDKCAVCAAKPDDIPREVWDVAEVHLRAHSHLLSSTEIVARAILAERERCAAKAESFILVYATSSHDIDVAMQGAAKEDAAAEIAAAIRKGTATPSLKESDK